MSKSKARRKLETRLAWKDRRQRRRADEIEADGIIFNQLEDEFDELDELDEASMEIFIEMNRRELIVHGIDPSTEKMYTSIADFSNAIESLEPLDINETIAYRRAYFWMLRVLDPTYRLDDEFDDVFHDKHVYVA